MQEETSGSTTINQYPNSGGWNGGPGWGWGAPYAAVPAYPAYGYGNGGFGGLDGLMRGFGGNINLGGGRGLAATGTALGATALGLVGIGLLNRAGGLFGGPGGPGCDNLVTKDYLGLVKENAALQATVAAKDSKIYTDDKIGDVVKLFIEWRQRQELIDTQTAAEVATLKNENANLKAMLGNMLGTYIQPQTFAPSQAVFSAMTANAAGKAANAGAGGSGN